MLKQYKFDSIIGPLFLVASSEALTGLFWEEQNVPYTAKLDGVLKLTVTQLKEYFAGKRNSFEIPLDLTGTDFQKSVWKSLQKIPFGKTTSYKDLALKLKNEKAVRAVGTANGRNPICIIIPCHRVIGSNGSLTGFSGGLDRKKKLLELEGHTKC